ncbi:MAG: hypothetical protein D6770_08050 [Anaerolineae bacterium]|nr:MAG: hypothetical protein D6770_08050 [Anaerolineae bacterium]
MSCEGNRRRFFERLQMVVPGLTAEELERVYQAGKARGTDDPDEATRKTRLLFEDMRRGGIRPPTHSPDGLPRPSSRAGYAAVFDLVRARAKAPTDEFSPDELAEFAWAPTGVNPHTLLSGENRTLNGFELDCHYYLDQEHTTHIWFGEHPPWKDLKEILLGGGPIVPLGPEEAQRMAQFCEQVDDEGYLPDGYSLEGFNRDGYDPMGYSIYGLTKEETNDPETVERTARAKLAERVFLKGRKTPKSITVDIEGFDENGFRPQDGDPDLWRDRFGFNRLGFREGRSWTGYDENGLDANGNPAPKRKGYDAWGYHRKEGLTAPDAQGRRYNLIGWVYDPTTDTCYNPQNPKQRMKHSGSYALRKVNGRYKVVLKRSYVPDVEAMKERIRTPTIRWEEYRRGGAPSPWGGTRFLTAGIHTEELVALVRSAEFRYLRSEARLKENPQATFAGVPLRCPRCGRFTGAAPHVCPHYGERRVLVMECGLVLAMEKDVAFNKEKGFIVGDALEGVVSALSPGMYSEVSSKEAFDEARKRCGLGDLLYVRTDDARVALDALWRRPGEMAVVVETPFSPFKEAFDPDYHGGPLPGYHWKSGLDENGVDPFGFHYLTGRHVEKGFSLISLKEGEEAKKIVSEVVRREGMDEKRLLEETYSRIATAVAGAPRRVTISEEGGPRPDMFWTDMRGRIQAERFPLVRMGNHDTIENLLAMKAGLYHELGHEEDTPVGLFRRILDIAQGREQVEGIPAECAGLVAEVYNILEDGRMERSQAKRRRGVAAVLAADARIQPRWDEKVGEEIPVPHQVMGMMLYRSLPFFRVRREVYEAAPVRVRKLFDEVRPLVDRAMHSPEETFAASIEITRRLLKDEAMRDLGRRMTDESSQGGAWVLSGGGDGEEDTLIIISALPKPAGALPDRSIPIPAPGWGRKHDEDEPGPGRTPAAQDEDEPGHGRTPNAQDEDEPGKEAGMGGSVVGVSPEPDEAFFDSVASSTIPEDVFGALLNDLRRGAREILRSPLEHLLQLPLRERGVVIDMDDRQVHIQVLEPFGEQWRVSLPTLRQAAREEGARIARRLETLREEIRRRTRFQTEGFLDRRRHKRAVAGAKTVRKRSRVQDVTSLAVSIQLDMSGSMMDFITGGQLAGATLALEEALQRLDAHYMVCGFGSHYALMKTFGDERIPEEQVGVMMTRELGGTEAAPAMRLCLLGLKVAPSANKIHIVMTDGALFDREEAAHEAQTMRRNGILPFGVFFGKTPPKENLDAAFGEGNWAHITHLSDLSEVVARRIERIYRRILATR